MLLQNWCIYHCHYKVISNPSTPNIFTQIALRGKKNSYKRFSVRWVTTRFYTRKNSLFKKGFRRNDPLLANRTYISLYHIIYCHNSSQPCPKCFDLWPVWIIVAYLPYVQSTRKHIWHLYIIIYECPNTHMCILKRHWSSIALFISRGICANVKKNARYKPQWNQFDIIWKGWFFPDGGRSGKRLARVQKI